MINIEIFEDEKNCIDDLDLLTISSADSDDVSNLSNLLDFVESNKLINDIYPLDFIDSDNQTCNCNHNKTNKYHDDPELDYMVDVFANKQKLLTHQLSALSLESNNKTNNIDKLHHDFFIYVSKHHNDLFHQVLNKII